MNRFDDEAAWADFTEKRAERPGCAIRYWVMAGGEGPWIVLLHGTGADHYMFTAQLPALAGRRVMAIDVRGQGSSTPASWPFSFDDVAGDVVALLDAEGIDSAIFVGQSAGGNIAQAIADRSPARALGLVVIDSAYNMQKLSAIDKFFVKTGGPLAALYPWDALVKASVEGSATSAEARAYLRRVFAETGKRDFIRAFSALADCMVDGKGRSLGLPILLVVGSEDRLGNILKFAPRWLELEPRCRLETLQGAGHCSNMDATEAFNASLSDFISSLEGSADGGNHGERP